MPYNENYINHSQFVEIGKKDVVLVVSENCNETMVLFQSPKSPLGIKGIIAITSNTDKVKTACIKVGINGTFKYAPLNEYGESYVCTQGQTEGIAICVKEIEENGEPHLKLCKVIIKTKKEENESEKLENEM